MIMPRNLYNICLAGLVAIATGLSGCEKLIEIDPPLNETSSATVFASDRSALGALSGMYGYFSQTQVQTVGLSVYTSLMGDDLRYLGLVTTTQEYMNNSYTPVTASPDAFTGWYATIYRANAIIEGLDKYSGTSESVKKEMQAEARLMRAYCYFNLVNFLGKVPLVVQTDVNVTAYQAQDSIANIYTQIIADLTSAKVNLRADYSFTSNDRTGVNKFTAAALLARVYTFTGDYAAAESNATEVIESGLFSLILSADIGKALFVKNSAESIWQLPPYILSTNQITAEASSFIPASNTVAAVQYELTPGLLQLFAANDLRRSRWMSDLNIGGNVYTIPFKYKYRSNATAVTDNVSENQVIMRLAEQYLIRAEARARLGNNLAGALSDLNMIRVRAGLDASTTADADALLDEIAVEYRREFFCEQAFRWYNLKRTNKADEVLSVLKPSWRLDAKLYPFAQSIINANPNLIQNTGY